MRKKIILVGICGAIIIAAIAALLQNDNSEIKTEKFEVVIESDVIMPNKVSRPGCEITDSCYIPSVITINQGEEVTWSNEDVAFHSVTSGTYDAPTDFFDSGHLDPGEKFSVSFDQKGEYDYFCTLHPWMKGKVLVG